MKFIRSDVLRSIGPQHRGVQLWVESVKFLIENPFWDNPFADHKHSLLKSVNAVYSIKTTGTDGVDFSIILNNGNIEFFNKEKADADISFKMPNVILFAIITGKLNPDKALITGKIKYEGDPAKLAVFLDVFHVLYELWIEDSTRGVIYRELVEFAEQFYPETRRG